MPDNTGMTGTNSDSSSDTLYNAPSPNMLEHSRKFAISTRSDIPAYHLSPILAHRGTRAGPRVSLQSTASERTLVESHNIKTAPFKLLHLVGIFDREHSHDLYIRFGECSTLWKEWKGRGHNGSVRKDIHKVSQIDRKLLVHMLEESWSWPLQREGSIPDFIQFLCFMRLEYHPKLKKCIAIAPMASEDISLAVLGCILSGLLRFTYGFPVASPNIPEKSTIKSNVVECSLRTSPIVVDINAEVAQSKEEFLYEIQKLVQALELFKQLQGFLLLLITPVNSKRRRILSKIAPKYPIPGVDLKKESGVLFYHCEDFNQFKANANRGDGFKVWQKDEHFMGLLDVNYDFPTIPRGRYPAFSEFVQHIICSYCTLLTEIWANKRQPHGLLNGVDPHSFDIDSDIMDVSSVSAAQVQLIMTAQVTISSVDYMESEIRHAGGRNGGLEDGHSCY